MSSPPTRHLRFRWPWRPYQVRVLVTVDRHLEDDRLHIVAAPGAGKTTLGLEVFRLLGEPALVLAPTLTIRDQWLLRLGDFLPQGEDAADWTSRDLRAPAFLTVTTYQSLLSRSRAEPNATEPEEPEDADDETDQAPSGEDVRSFLSTLRDAGVRTLILDEAHHLRQEWWKALARVVDELEGLTLVSLTATPPYDATGREWQRYEELCGPIDDEISVPELVKAGTLCPHQDFVLAVSPDAEEVREIRGHDGAVQTLLQDLVEDAELRAQVERHPWISEPWPDPGEVLARPELAVALLVYLRASAAELPEPLPRLLDIQAGDLPFPGRRWWQVLLTEYLFGSTFHPSRKAHRDRLATRLRTDGLLWRRDLRIERSRPAERTLTLSAAKVAACLDVYGAERQVRQDDLRQVILTDYIRDDGWTSPPGTIPVELGALPVFDALTGAAPQAESWAMSLVTGRLFLIHESRADAFLAALGKGQTTAKLTTAPARPGWLRVEGTSGSRLVGAFTQLLTSGELHVLVGTRSLLGEGWDAPVVNSLILASFVGSFISTNQMRGRAIRTDPAAPHKVASVWHLAALAPDTPTGVMDMEQLAQRFRTFVGLSAKGDVIESGIERLELSPVTSARDIPAFNEANLRRHGMMDEVAEGWRGAIQGAGTGKVVPTLRVAKPPTARPFLFNRTLRYLLYEVGWSGLLGLGWKLVDVGRADSLESFGILLMLAAGGAMLGVAPRFLRTLRLALRHLPVDGSVAQMGKALVESLRTTELVADPEKRLSVRTERGPRGSVTVSLEGGTFYEQSLFADCMGELLGPVENPRYLITRSGSGLKDGQKDFHSVPTCLGINKERANALLEAWQRFVGPAELIFTRREGGRALLLAARTRAFSSVFEDPSERLDRWQ